MKGNGKSSDNGYLGYERCKIHPSDVLRRIISDAPVVLGVWGLSASDPLTQIRSELCSLKGRQQERERLSLYSLISLELSNLNPDDSGVYQIQIIDEGLSKIFHLTVYSHVSRPQIRLLNHSPDHFLQPPASVYELQSNSSCSVLCSVENGREVTLSWQREGEILNHTSSPDLTTNLSLPLEIEENSTPYSCVAANPVSNETALLNTELCAQYRGIKPAL
ncbi:hypothetical protein AGOR_G00192040 [Albula goreensis]|uniref:Ig-like domain-containing protein n=1 Tax=Albula goreensis TaxID=1534307 RepID=A0A8T3CYA3_9TELE|nr:hypothetical protein AGOR_G00192040 [Albula goreensis]